MKKIHRLADQFRKQAARRGKPLAQGPWRELSIDDLKETVDICTQLQNEGVEINADMFGHIFSEVEKQNKLEDEEPEE